MLPTRSIFDCIARITSLPARETESPPLDYGEPLESFWKHSLSLLSRVQGIKLKEVMNKVCDRLNCLSKFHHHHSGAIWCISTPCTWGRVWMDPCRVELTLAELRRENSPSSTYPVRQPTLGKC